jgi:hypothetical protein
MGAYAFIGCALLTLWLVGLIDYVQKKDYMADVAACNGRLVEENGRDQTWLCADKVRRHIQRPG